MTLKQRAKWAGLLILLSSCYGIMMPLSSDGKGKKMTEMEKKSQEQWKTERIGRFAIDLPAVMHRAGQRFSLRYAEIEEIVWPEGKKEEVRTAAWETNLAKIQKKTPPEGKENMIIEVKEFPTLSFWAKGVLHYGNSTSGRKAQWDILTDRGDVGFWLRLFGLAGYSNEMVNDMIEIAKAYRVVSGSDIVDQEGNWFYLEHGAINLPYLEDEALYVRFEGHPLKVKVEIEMNAVQQVEQPGLIDRTEAAIIGKFAPGLKVDKIRSRKKTVAGLKGEEEILRGRVGNDRELSFDWMYLGKEDSGEYPEILISMDSFDDTQLEAKTLLWDRMLDSMKPMYQP